MYTDAGESPLKIQPERKGATIETEPNSLIALAIAVRPADMIPPVDNGNMTLKKVLTSEYLRDHENSS